MYDQLMVLFYTFIAVATVFLVLIVGNYPKFYRYKQAYHPFVAFGFSLVGALIFFKFINRELFVKIGLPRLLDWFYIPIKLPLEFFPTLYFCLCVILFYAVLKQIFLIPFRLSAFFKKGDGKGGDVPVRRSRDGSIKMHVFGAYREERSGVVVLKEEWEFIYTFVKYLSVTAAALVLVMLILSSFGLKPGIGDFNLTMPASMVLVLFVALEVLFYLGGDRGEYVESAVTGSNVKARQKGDYHDIWKEYQQRWPDKLLYAARLAPITFPTTAKENLFSQLDSSIESKQELMTGVSRLLDAGYALTARDCHIIKELYQGKDLIMSDPNYNHVAPILIHMFQRAVRRNRNILILIPYSQIEDQDYSDAFNQWFGKWNNELSQNSKPTAPRFFKPNSHIEAFDKIIVASPEDLLDQNIIRNEWFSNLHLVVFFDATSIFARSLTPSSILLDILRQTNPALQTIVIADYCKSLESSVRRNLDIQKGNELKIQKTQTPRTYLILWQLEGIPTFQETAFDGYIESHLGAEVVLAVLPWRDRLSPIRLAGQEHATSTKP